MVNSLCANKTVFTSGRYGTDGCPVRATGRKLELLHDGGNLAKDFQEIVACK